MQIRPDAEIIAPRPAARPEAARRPERAKPAAHVDPPPPAQPPAQPGRSVPRGSFVNIRV